MREKWRAGVVAALSFAILALVTILQWPAGRALDLSLVYFVPVSLGAFGVGRVFGLVLAGLAAAGWYLGEWSLPADYSHEAVPLVNLVLRLVLFAAAAAVFARLRAALDRENALALTDFLTGIANRRAFFLVAERELQRARRTGSPLTLAVIDLDDFKQVNDRHGHEEGDELLRVMAARMMAEIRATDVVARLGGDEFVILMADTDLATAGQILARLRSALAEATAERGDAVRVTMGAVTCVHPPELDVLLRQADLLMYRGKARGKDVIEQAALC